MAKSKAKPLSFSTTIRNPERIPNFLRCILPFEGKILTSEIIHEVIKNVIREKEYIPLYVTRTTNLKQILLNNDISFSDQQLEEIILNSPQKHKEKGFNYGWDSRFDTWYKMIKEFGFIKYSMGEKISVTSTGHMLVDAFMEEPVNSKKIHMVFLNALMRYQTNNPLRKNANENAPLPLLLQVIQYLHEDPNENDAGLERHELPIMICWRDNNALAAYKYIKQMRKKAGFNYSDEFVYEKCLELLGTDNRNYIKIGKICRESVDEYIRKMRMSGLLSLRGNGRFLDINRFEKNTVQYVIRHYSSYPKFTTENEYIDYMGTIDSNILQIETIQQADFSDIRKRKLYEYASEKTKEFVKNELSIVSERKESHDSVLKFISAPTRLEFLTSVALVQHFKGLDVNPNYAVDDEGLPTFTAGGGLADIECYDSDYDSYFEVSLMCGKSDQVYSEILPISRHLQEIKVKKRQESFSVFVAPVIHKDTIEAAEWQEKKYNIDILTLSINEFLTAIANNERVSSLLLNKSNS